MGISVECVLDERRVPSQLYCPICTDLILPKDGLLSPCGHMFCSMCITQSLQMNRQCPEDRQPLLDSGLRTVRDGNPLIYRMLGEVSVRCTNFMKDCDWQGELSELPVHMNVCVKEVDACSVCKRYMQRDQLDQHKLSCGRPCEDCAEKDEELAEYRRELVRCRAKLADLRVQVQSLCADQSLDAEACLRFDKFTLRELGQFLSRHLHARPPHAESAQIFETMRQSFADWQKRKSDNPPTISDDLVFALASALASKGCETGLRRKVMVVNGVKRVLSFMGHAFSACYGYTPLLFVRVLRFYPCTIYGHAFTHLPFMVNPFAV
ncbi:hypothetical protein CBR_g49555 [Chara braunii]|uniref:RING-type domain-containing protein n=1 Tax=Chara braunii TaxID=69332 RepID=A0A388M5F8_CHABU|nr:hypothetical protein CBR_g49555 [Chara braunii]|eukprot:GBG89702.1 hypothetical protein CBR_g49555 [Chara braunii]